MRADETVSFFLGNAAAQATPTFSWQNDNDVHAIDLNATGQSAPVADFTATPTSGFAPLAVHFTDLSQGAVTGWQWDFGDGGTSTTQNPDHTYQQVGRYTVQLTASGPGGSNTRTRTSYIVVVSSAPSADFSGAPTSGIAPLTVSFNNLSTSYTAALWSFGDNTTSDETQPNHTYTQKGHYTVSLIVLGPAGSATETKSEYITVYAPVSADFSTSPTAGQAPLVVQFTNLTSGDWNGLAWNFGDGQTSTAINPSHTYASSGTYTVTLIASGPGGIDTEQKTALIQVQAPLPSAAFTADPTSGLVPLSVQFTNQSNNAQSYVWDFGDGENSASLNPDHIYTTGGVYTVTLTATGPGGSNTLKKASYITVHTPVTAAFSATPESGTTPLIVQFTNLSTGSWTSLAWSFGDGGTSSLANPQHTYNSPGTYQVSLEASGPGGSSSHKKTIQVNPTAAVPAAAFTANQVSGVLPFTVQFTNQSSRATSYMWTFGDGGSSDIEHPLHTFTSRGVYTVTLSATGPGGTAILAKPDYITVYAPALAGFRAVPTQGHTPLTVQFTNQSSGDYTSLEWNFGDGQSSNVPNPSHTYLTGGVYSVSLTVSGPGGTNTQTKTGLIIVQTQYSLYLPVTKR